MPGPITSTKSTEKVPRNQSVDPPGVSPKVLAIAEALFDSRSHVQAFDNSEAEESATSSSCTSKTSRQNSLAESTESKIPSQLWNLNGHAGFDESLQKIESLEHDIAQLCNRPETGVRAADDFKTLEFQKTIYRRKYSLAALQLERLKQENDAHRAKCKMLAKFLKEEKENHRNTRADFVEAVRPVFAYEKECKETTVRLRGKGLLAPQGIAELALTANLEKYLTKKELVSIKQKLD